jgi:transposase-like protein
MVRVDREPLEGPVEIDNGFLGGKKTPGPSPFLFKTRVVVAVEVPGKTRKTVGRVRFRVIPDFSAETLTRFVQEVVAPGASVITDGWSGYAPLKSQGFKHQIRVVGDPRRASRLLPHVNRVLALVKRWLLGTHHGRVDPKHLPQYLEEFSFRFNRRKSKHV